MLVVISDLHFVDGTAGEQDVPWQAFENVFLSDIAELAEHNNAKEIKLLLLGDVIDLLRTRKWLETDTEDRPWGKNGLKDIKEFDPQKGSKTEKHCCWILEGIIERNKKTFQLLRGFKKTFEYYFNDKDKVQIIYVPGNHDRLVNFYPSIRDTVTKVLGLTINDKTVNGFPGNNWRFRNAFEDKEYGVFARHGHEFDELNYESRDKDSLEGHYQVPIGDVVTTEFAVRIADLLLPVVEELPTSDKDEMKQFIYGIDNIRPWTSIPGYLLTKFKKYREMRKPVACALCKTFKNVLKIRFARRWFLSHPLRVISDLCHCVIGALRPTFLVTSSKDLYAKAANKDYAEKKETFPFVLYGHTHSENQVPINHDKGIDSFYINTGTWRSRIEPTLDQEEYVSLKTMTYTIFYAADERPSKCFDIWTGCQSNRRVQKSLQIKHPLRTDK
jgi:UDP-2,3-diacylglucosamine pyrophosphatase LpxH